MGQCTREVSRLLGIHQDFIPSFTHHCLGLCERTHRTLAERFTPYVQQQQGWDFILPAIVFSMNSSVNPSTKYSPFEKLNGKRPSFTLSIQQTPHVNDLPNNMISYMKQNVCRLETVRNIVKENSTISQQKMENIVNEKVHEIKLSIGDYVYLERESNGQGRKFKNTYDGPFTVNSIPSPHLILLRDPEGKRKFKRPVHVNRLKVAYVRVPDPKPYFHENSNTSSSETSTEGSDDGKSSETAVEHNIVAQQIKLK